jgi:hypothetical protein
MLPLDQYLMDRDAEIAMARSAAPPSMAKDATVMVLGRHGYETGLEERNGFVCMMGRSWIWPKNNSAFGDPKIYGTVCFNAAAARSYLLTYFKKTELALAGGSNTQIEDVITESRKVSRPHPMAYLMSKQSVFECWCRGI